jgi:nucleoporin NUP42
MRLRHYILAAQGQEQQAIQEAQNLYAETEKQIQTILNDIDGAIKYIVNGENQHPNRYDVINEMQKKTSGFAASTFGQPTTGTTFRQPTNPLASANSNPFTAPKFGQSTFGQPTSVGGQTSTFGQPSAPQSTFGQPTPFGQQPAFGQPNPLGPKPNPFGQATFGQPTQPAAQLSAPTFGQPSNPFSNIGGQPQAFVQPAQPSGFGKPSFGQPTQPSGFGQPTQPSQFGAATSQIPTLQASTTAVPPAVSPFGTTQPASNPFNAKPTTNPFTAPPASTTNIARPNLNQPPATTTPSPFPTKPPVGETRRDASGRLTLWHGRPVVYVTPLTKPSSTSSDPKTAESYPCYKREDGKLQRIIFPNGRKLNPTPGDGDNTGIEGRPEEYTEEVKKAYEYMKVEGRFKDGVMPSVPPKREWISWDF